MGRIRAAGASVLGALALGATLAAWLQSPPSVTAQEAIDVVREALLDAGLVDVVVDRAVEAGRYAPEGADSGIDVWKTEATVEGGRIRLWLARSDAEPVFLDDRTPDGSGQILDDSQYEHLARLDADPGFARHLRRNLLATGAGSAIMLLALALGTAPMPPVGSRSSAPAPLGHPRKPSRLAAVGPVQSRSDARIASATFAVSTNSSASSGAANG